MQGYTEDVEIDQRAKGTLEVLDYEALALAEVVVGSDTLVEGTDFDAETSNDVTATNLAAAIAALTGVGAAAVGAVVTVSNDASGEVGNAVVFTTDADPAAMSISGAGTLEGGVDEQYTEWESCVAANGLGLQLSSFLKAITGSGTPSVTATVQFSNDKINAFDYSTQPAGAFTVADTPQLYFNYYGGLFFRHKLVAAGTNTVATMALQGIKT